MKLVTPVPAETPPVWAKDVKPGEIVRFSDVGFQAAIEEEAFLVRIDCATWAKGTGFMQFGGNLFRSLSPVTLMHRHSHKLEIGKAVSGPVRAKITDVGSIVRLHHPAEEEPGADKTYWLEKHPIPSASCPFVLVSTEGNSVIEIDEATLVVPYESKLTISPIVATVA
jgi:hypothetical protein